jgi:protein MpaA
MNRHILHDGFFFRSHENRPIELYSNFKVGEASHEKTILLIGGVHGDEPEGVSLANSLLSWLQKNNSEVKVNWALIPCLNPDGFAKSMRTNARGVDLNRNFPTPDWIPSAKAPRYFPGITPASEQEVKGLIDLLKRQKFALIVHFHSWEPCVVYSGKRGRFAAELLANEAQMTAREDIGYPTPGSLGQYGLLSIDTPVICVEAQEKTPLDHLWPLFGPGLKRLLSLTDFTSILKE